MKLVYSKVQQTYCFYFGDAPINLHEWNYFFETRKEAVYAAQTLGLRVTNRNTVKVQEAQS